MFNVNLPTTELAGRARIKIEDKTTGEIKQDTGWFDNLITDYGLDAMGEGSECMKWCILGSNNTPPVNTDSVTTELMRATSAVSVTTASNSDPATRFWVSRTRHYQFSPTASITIADLGLSDGTVTGSQANLTTRTLVKDASGSPTTISALSTDVIHVYYEIRLYAPKSGQETTTSTVNVITDGVSESYNVTIIPYNYAGWTGVRVFQTITNFGNGGYQPTFGRQNLDISNFYEDSTATPGTAGLTTLVGSHNFYNKTTSPYVTGSHEREITMVHNNAVHNTPWTNIRAFIIGAQSSFGDWQVKVSKVSDGTGFSKTKYQSVTIKFKVHWSRYAP